ncbi:MAG: ABC transporter ATP-binding protein [Candidatus Coatesbacteria bacterium]|nr:ABC transporter ATP-binding protein [Candidatus Coatesbacteria bacterium]
MALIELVNINKIYTIGKVNVHALKDINLKIDNGEFLSLVGPSGSGKTTLLNLIGSLDKPTSGEIFLENSNLAKFSYKEQAVLRRKKIGFIFQSYNLIPVLTAFENVEFPLLLEGLMQNNDIKSKVNMIMDEVGLEEQKYRRPDLLSGGQQQRVAIARALVKNPSIILADEPTANLDSKTAEEILNLMLDLNKKYNTTFIFSTHDKLVMEFAKRIVTLKDGFISKDEVK